MSEGAPRIAGAVDNLWKKGRAGTQRHIRRCEEDWKENARTVFRAGVEPLGWEMGLEPTTTGITIRDSTN